MITVSVGTSEHYLTHRMLSAKDRSLRRMLGYQRDEIQVYERDSVSENCFFVRLVFRMFQKRLRIARKLEVEFVARGMWSVLWPVPHADTDTLIAEGRIWALRFYTMGPNGMWQVGYGLSEHSSPVLHPKAELAIWAYGGPPHSSCATQKPLIINMKRPWYTLVPEV
jgi:hypothetical protein